MAPKTTTTATMTPGGARTTSLDRCTTTHQEEFLCSTLCLRHKPRGVQGNQHLTTQLGNSTAPNETPSTSARSGALMSCHFGHDVTPVGPSRTPTVHCSGTQRRLRDTNNCRRVMVAFFKVGSCELFCGVAVFDWVAVGVVKTGIGGFELSASTDTW